MICTLIDNQISRHFYTYAFIDTYVLAKISWVVKPIEIEREDWIQQNRISQYFFGVTVADIPTSFSKIETVPKMTHMSGHSENKPSSETFRPA